VGECCSPDQRGYGGLLVGFLRTVTGMIGAFGIMSEAGLGQPHAVTGGVAEALIATAAGLFVAIMTLLPYNYFPSKVSPTVSPTAAVSWVSEPSTPKHSPTG
jgi:biopolymer transport protein ExbB/TolQ